MASSDDVALVAKAEEAYTLESMLTKAARRTNAWLTSVGLELAAQVRSNIIYQKKKIQPDDHRIMNGANINSDDSVKYLRTTLHFKLSFSKQAKEVVAEVSVVAQKIRHILPNISAATPHKRRLLGNVVYSLLLYGASM